MAISSEVEKLERRWNENPSGLTFAPLAEAYRKAGDQQRALEILEVGLAVHPDYVPALIVRGRCHLDSASLTEAEFAFQQVLARDPANPIALRGMADLCERGGRVPEAIERLELLLEVDRSNAEARADLARLRSAPAVTELERPLGAPEAGETPAAALPPGPDAEEEDALRIENLSVDPMVAEEAQEAPRPEARLPWEPLEMPGWGQSTPEPLEPVAEAPASEERWAEADPTAGPGNAPLDGLMTVSDPSAEPRDSMTDEPSGPVPVPVWDWGAAATSEDPTHASPGAEAVPDGAETTPENERPIEAAPVEAVSPETPAAMDVDEGDEAAAPVIESEPVAETVAAEWSAPSDQAESPSEGAGQAGAEEPTSQWGEVALEAAASESHMMSHPVPPESPEAAEITWPAVTTADEEAMSPEASRGVQPEPVDAPAAARMATAEPADEPALIVTESMAELFLRQGHRELSLAVYRQLLERSPTSESLLQAIARLEGETAARQAAKPTVDRPSRAASLTGGEAVGAMLQAVLSSPPPVSESTVLPPAIEPIAAGEPARPGTEPLTLGQVFGDEPSLPPPARDGAPAPAGEPSFDEFFGASSAGADTAAPGGGPRSPAVEDMRQFTDWLKGLKR